MTSTTEWLGVLFSGLVLVVAQLSGQQAQQPGPGQLRIERHLEMMRGMTTALAWSPTGDRLAIGGILGDVVVVDAKGGNPIRLRSSSGNYDDSVGHLCWSAAGEQLLVSTRTHLALFDVEQRTMLVMRQGVSGHVIRVVGSPDFVCIHRHGNPQRIAGATLAAVATIELPPGGAATRLAMAPDGKRLAVATNRACQLFVYDFASGQLLETIPHDPGAVAGLGWSDTASKPWWLAGRDLHAFGVTGRFWGHAMVVGPAGRRVAVRRNHDWQVVDPEGAVSSLGPGLSSLALHPDGVRWARGFDGRVDFGHGTEVVHSIDAPVTFENVHQGSLVSGGRVAVLQGYRGALEAFRVSDGASVSVAQIPGPGRFVRCDYGPELVWATQGHVSWWRLDAGGVLRQTERFRHRLQPEVIHGGGRLHGRWLSQDHMGPVDIRGEAKPPPGLSQAGRTLSVLGGKTRWLSFGYDQIRFLDGDGKTVRNRSCSAGVVDVVASPSRSRVAVYGNEHKVQILDLATGEVSTEVALRGDVESSAVRGVRWIDERRVLVTGVTNRRGYVAVHSASTGKESERIAFRDAVSILDIEPDAKRALVATVGRASVIHWD